MILLKKIEIHVFQEFSTPQELSAFKTAVTTAVAAHMKTPPTVYNTFETWQNTLVIAQPEATQPDNNH